MPLKNVSLKSALALVGCATKQVDQFERGIVRAYADQLFRDCPKYALTTIGSRGEYEDARILSTRAATGFPSAPAVTLAKELDRARTRRYCVVVTGVSSNVAAAIIAEALSLSPEKDLQKLRLLFVGDAKDKDTVRCAVESRGSVFYFVYR